MPDTGFSGRDETLFLLDRAFDDHPVVLLHPYAEAALRDFQHYQGRVTNLEAQTQELLAKISAKL